MRRRALTLVEMIVVLATVALLAGLLVPALARVGAAGRSTRCLANLRQMGVAALHYATTYERWPAAIRYERPDGAFRQVAWDWVTTMDGELIGPGPLWAFADDPGRTQQCPDYHGTTNFAGDPHTGYAYNTSYLGGEARFPQTGWDAVREGTPPHLCSRASRCAMFGDGGRANGTNKFMRAPLNHEGHELELIYSGGLAFRHLDATNVAFVDGHVASRNTPHEGRHATPDLLERFMGHPDNGFLSDDDSAYAPR
jgi:prepilin-type processing-associated H-X9-DG protein